jgi:hypothetical protein
MATVGKIIGIIVDGGKAHGSVLWMHEAVPLEGGRKLRRKTMGLR